MNDLDIPIGRLEDQRLELKGAEALSRPHRIGREVVAMLNAEGGAIWIGIREEEGRAVELQVIPEVRRQVERLRDSLVDTISPSIRESEVRVDEVLVEGTSGVIRIVVNPEQARRPYGLTRGSDWLFPRRIGARIRSLSHDELREMFQHGGGRTGDETANALRQELDVLRKKGRDVLWVRLQPDPPLRLDLTAVRDGDFLTDPRVTGNRAIGKSFTNAAVLGGERPRLKVGSVSIGREGIFFVTVFRDGGLLFEAPLTTLFAGGRDPELSSEALMEYPTSILRLCSALLAASQVFEAGAPAPETEIVAVLALLGLGGWRLRPGSPQQSRAGWKPQPRTLDDQDDLVFAQPPLRFRSDEVRERPDECGFRLWSQVYEAFGFWPEDYPPEYDATTGRLVLPR